MNDHDILQVKGINSKGFGIISKLAMQDKRLTIEAKGIYAYFCSYAGNGKTAFPRVTKIIGDLVISKDRYYKHFNLLKQYGYIESYQVHQDGRLKHNVYTLMDEIQFPCFKDTEFQDTVFQDTENKDTINNNSINNNSINNNSVREKEATPTPTQKTYGEFQQVNLSDEEYTKLVKDYGQAKIDDYIGQLDRSIASKGKQYKNHCATIKTWIIRDEKNASEEKKYIKPHVSKPKENRFANFEQRQWDDEQLKKLEQLQFQGVK